VQAVDNSYQGGPFAQEQTVFINPPGNGPPVITALRDLVFPEDTTGRLIFFVTDDRSPPETLRLHAASSNPELFSPASLKLSGFIRTNGALRVDLTLTPTKNRFGRADITLTATDRGGLATSRFFVVEVTPVNDSPVIGAAERHFSLAGAPTSPLAIHVSDLETPADQLVVTARSLTPSLVPDLNLALTHFSGDTWSLVVTPATAEPAQAQVELTVVDAQGLQARRTITIVFQAASFTVPEAVLELHRAGSAGVQLELRARPDTRWRLEASSDLQNWYDHPAPGVALQTSSNGADQMNLPISDTGQFFRVRRIE
jgi:hypothetical protein